MISNGLLDAAAASLAVDIQHAIPIRTRCQSVIARDANPPSGAIPIPSWPGLTRPSPSRCLLTEIASFTLSVRTATLVALPTKKEF